MSKLFKLKEWLTVADAAQHLTIVFGEEVAEADVLRFALDGHLKLSVNFVNHAKAKCGQIVSWEGTEWFLGPSMVKAPPKNGEQENASDKIVESPMELQAPPEFQALLDKFLMGIFTSINNIAPGEDPEKFLESPPKLQILLDQILMDKSLGSLPFLKSLNIDGERFLNLSDEVVTLRGVWDLSMIGNERLDIEHAYQNLTGGPAVTLEGIDGAFVQKSDEQMYQLQESFDDNEYQSGSRAQLEELKARIVNEDIEKSEAERLLNQHKEKRKKYLEARELRPKSMDYYPAGGLPEGSVLVVRTEALRDFERKITETPEQSVEKPLSTTERNSLLTIIGLMAKDGYGDDLSKPYSLAKEIRKAAELLSIKISDDTIATKFKDAKQVLDEKYE